MNITIKDVGPINQLSIPVPEDGGIIVLTGRNGAGKSEALAATETLMRGSGALSKRDRCLTHGVVQGFGATIKVGAKTTRSGELEVTSLEDRLHVSDLVDPQIKDVEAADAKRIKALVSLSGVVADKQSFYGGYESVVKPEIEGIDDPIEAAAGAKRALELEARRAEVKATESGAMAHAAARSIEGVDLTVESDTRKLQAAHTEAVKLHTKLLSEQNAARLAEMSRFEASSKLAAEVKAYTGQSVKDAATTMADAESDGKIAAKAVATAEQVLIEAKHNLDMTRASYRAALNAHGNAVEHDRLVTVFKESINANLIEPPADDQISEAAAAVSSASKAIEQGVIIRTAQAEHDNLTAYQVEAKEFAKRAEALRLAAGKIDEALSDAVACDELRVEGGRLVTDTDERGPTYFADLSVGQRWKIALRIAIAAVGERGVLVVPQTCWEGLDPENRAIIAAEVAGRKVTIITAEPSSGELRATQFTNEDF